MTVGEVYEKYKIPVRLQEHMARVASVVAFIKAHWVGGEVDWDLLTKRR